MTTPTPDVEIMMMWEHDGTDWRAIPGTEVEVPMVLIPMRARELRDGVLVDVDGFMRLPAYAVAETLRYVGGDSS